MTRKLKISLVCIHVFLVLVGFYFGVPTLDSHIPTDKRTSEQNLAIAAQSTDLEKLKAIIKADDVCIRADRELASLFREGLITASGVAVAVGMSGLVLICFCGSKNKVAS